MMGCVGLGQFVRRFLTYGVSQRAGKAKGKLMGLFLMLATPLFAEEVTVLALGDSLTQGYGLAEAQGLVPQLERWLQDQGAQVSVINGGVSGDTTAGGAARVEWSLTPDVDAMIVSLGANDMLRGIDPEVTRANLDSILRVASDKAVPVLLVGQVAPGNFGPDFKARFDGLFGELAQIHNSLLYPSFFAGLGETDPAALTGFFQADGIHPNVDGVAKIVDGLGPSVLKLIDQVE